MTQVKYLPLSLPAGANRRERQGFARLCAALVVAGETEPTPDHSHWLSRADIRNLYDQPHLAAAAHMAIDLVDQGWTVQVDRYGPLFAPPCAHRDRELEKQRIRRQEHIRRDEQLRRPSVRRFIDGMERQHEYGRRLVSVFDLMRDGRELADALRSQSTEVAISPYVQLVDESSCTLTGFRLHDIWRYFRHTWTNAYSTVPGRSMPILIRDAATEHHAVIGLAAVSSPVVQIAERDRWMGWETDQFIEAVAARPSLKVARWIARRLKTQRDEIYTQDLLLDGVLQPRDVNDPTADVIARLRADAERHRRRHHRAGIIREVRNIDKDAWVQRAETDLFRSKRAAALAEALEAASALGAYLLPNPSLSGLRAALDDPKARAQLRRVVRRARGERVGTVVADLTVCGAVAPYNTLAAGKLVGALAVSPVVLAAYRAKYNRPSEIASAMAGRPIVRETRLSFVGTTSLYGTGSSQYNRLRWPAAVVGGMDGAMGGYYELGRSRSFGTSHISDETVEALVRLSSLTGELVRVNSLFGEGVSPRLRKVRLGLASLGWPANELLKHGRERIVYGVPLVNNLREYSLGVDQQPDYLLDPDLDDADQRVSAWWFDRWGRRRAAQPDVITAMREHTLTRPITHGARVPIATRDGDNIDSETEPGRGAAM